MYQEIREQPAQLKKLLSNNIPRLKKMAAQFQEKSISSIHVAARGTSNHVAIFSKYLAEVQLGIPVNLMAPSIINLYCCPLQLSKALTIGISQSGSAPDVIGVLQQAHGQGGVTLAITNEEDSQLSQITQHALFCGVGEEKSVAATKTCTASMMLLAGLLGAWGQDQDLIKALEMVPPALDRLMLREKEIESLVQRFKDIEEILILGRGFNYASALETALKIKETCYINASSYSTADFFHGPIAVVDQGLSVLIYAFKGPLLPGILETITCLREMGTRILLVTDEPSLLGEDTIFYIPEDLPEQVTPFFSIVFGQLFSCFLAEQRGLNPDEPRNLKKITRTL